MTHPIEPGDARSMRERMLAGDLYLADDPELVAAALRARRLQDVYNCSDAEEEGERQLLLAELFASVGEDTVLRPPIYVDYGAHIAIGARCFANYGLVALDVAAITIGDDVQIGPNVQLLTPTHPTDPELRRARWEAAAPITIGDNVWIGGGAIVLAGVTIGAHTVVGAGAVVTRDLPPRVVAVGSPARVIDHI